jgi:hypothetical protein
MSSNFEVRLSDGTIAHGTSSEWQSISAYCYLLSGKVRKAASDGDFDKVGEAAQEHLANLAEECRPQAETEVAALLESKDKEFLAELDAEMGVGVIESTEVGTVEEGVAEKRRGRKKAAVSESARSEAIEALISRKAKMLAFEKVVRLLVGKAIAGKDPWTSQREILSVLCSVYGNLPEERYYKDETTTVFCPDKIVDVVNLLVQAIAQGFDAEELAA